MGKKVDCQFNIFNQGRTYTGNHRKYLLDNAKAVIESEATKEKLGMRELYGFYGHGRRILAKKMNISEVEAVKLPNGGSAIISNVPSNVTTAISIADDGTVSHTQEILDSETGKIVASLHDSKIGGFSWACPGSDGGKTRATIMSGFAGMDYVLHPGFAMNRGFVFESANSEIEDDGFSTDMILESIVKATGEDDKKAEAMLKGWMNDAQFVAMDLQEQLENAALYEAALIEQMEGQAKDLLTLEDEKRKALQAQEEEKQSRKRTVDFIVANSPVFIPEDVAHAMLENDFATAQEFFKKAKAVNFNSLPIDASKLEPKGEEGGKSKEPKYGSASTAWKL